MSDHLKISWHDSAWIPHLNLDNILDYFCQKSNPFYDKHCNNEIAKMQKLNPDQMTMMQGIEYVKLHAQVPILYVIRQQKRHGPEQVDPLVDYYILAGVVYQAPDVNSIIQSRVLNCTLNLKTALEEFQAISSFSPSTGHAWKHQQQAEIKQAAAAGSSSSKTTTSRADQPVQGPSEYTRFQFKVNALMKSFNESN